MTIKQRKRMDVAVNVTRLILDCILIWVFYRYGGTWAGIIFALLLIRSEVSDLRWKAHIRYYHPPTIQSIIANDPTCGTYEGIKRSKTK